MRRGLGEKEEVQEMISFLIQDKTLNKTKKEKEIGRASCRERV